MTDDTAVIRTLYDHFNARNIDGVLRALAPDIVWANGMDGGHVHGHAGVRDYWTRQWAVVSPHVEPTSIARQPDGSIAVEVDQSVQDLQGRPLEVEIGGLRSKTVRHTFRMQEGKVVRFDIL